jgi:photosystem II stability/assembly factor-like uncharacterized protein
VWLSAAAAAIVVVVVGVAVWASRSPSGTPGAGGDAGMEHVHGLGVNPADGTLHVATHHGVFRVSDSGATRVGQGRQDAMGFTVVGDNHFLGSGHPAPGSGGAAHLGLIESTDGGVTWQTLSLEGEADFHALRYRHDTVYGYNSTSGTLLVSTDKKSWDDRGRVTLRDFVVSPSHRDSLVASGERGVMRSTDGGRSWKTGAGKPVLLLDWPTADRLWALGLNGEVMRSADAGETWSDLGAVDGVATAFAVHETTLYVATQEGRIQRSTDEGKTWQALYP